MTRCCALLYLERIASHSFVNWLVVLEVRIHFRQVAATGGMSWGESVIITIPKCFAVLAAMKHA